MLALTGNGDIYFWGKHSTEAVAAKPKLVGRNLGVVKNIATTRACTISVCQTDTMVYFWGQWHGKLISGPMPTGHGSVANVFACADAPTI